MNAGGTLGMNADEDGWADDMAERWFEEGDAEQGQGDDPSREDHSSRTRGAPPA